MRHTYENLTVTVDETKLVYPVYRGDPTPLMKDRECVGYIIRNLDDENFRYSIVPLNSVGALSAKKSNNVTVLLNTLFNHLNPVPGVPTNGTTFKDLVIGQRFWFISKRELSEVCIRTSITRYHTDGRFYKIIDLDTSVVPGDTTFDNENSASATDSDRDFAEYYRNVVKGCVNTLELTGNRAVLYTALNRVHDYMATVHREWIKGEDAQTLGITIAEDG